METVFVVNSSFKYIICIVVNYKILVILSIKKIILNTIEINILSDIFNINFSVLFIKIRKVFF